MDSIDVKHDENNYKFYFNFDDKEAYLRYNLDDDRTMDIFQTYVPPALRGRNIAARLTEKALLFARENEYAVIPSCSYVEAYIEKNRDYRDLVIDSLR